MYILIAAATAGEIPTFLHPQHSDRGALNHELNILVTGVGSMLTAFSLARSIFVRKPDLIIQAGIAGSIDPNLSLTETVIIQAECLADLGVMENQLFSDGFDMGLLTEDFPFTGKSLVNPMGTGKKDLYGYRLVNGVTVNEISTDAERIKLLSAKYGASTESMEGAALHYVALMENIPFLQIRSISNRVGERDKTNWRIEGALTSLHTALRKILEQL